MAVATKAGVRSFGPRIPYPAVFPRSEECREFLLTKLINSERAAMECPVFKQKMKRTKASLLNQCFEHDNGKHKY